MRTPKFRIRKLRKYAWPAWTPYVWMFVCCDCGRASRRTSWRDAMNHAELHDCTPGSLW